MIYRIYKPDGSYRDYKRMPNITKAGHSIELLSDIDGSVIVNKIELKVVEDGK